MTTIGTLTATLLFQQPTRHPRRRQKVFQGPGVFEGPAAYPPLSLLLSSTYLFLILRLIPVLPPQ